MCNWRKWRNSENVKMKANESYMYHLWPICVANMKYQSEAILWRISSKWSLKSYTSIPILLSAENYSYIYNAMLQMKIPYEKPENIYQKTGSPGSLGFIHLRRLGEIWLWRGSSLAISMKCSSLKKKNESYIRKRTEESEEKQEKLLAKRRMKALWETWHILSEKWREKRALRHIYCGKVQSHRERNEAMQRSWYMAKWQWRNSSICPEEGENSCLYEAEVWESEREEESIISIMKNVISISISEKKLSYQRKWREENQKESCEENKLNKSEKACTSLQTAGGRHHGENALAKWKKLHESVKRNIQLKRREISIMQWLIWQ